MKVLTTKGYKVTQTHIKRGIGAVVSNTGLLGRWQVLQTQPTLVCDTAHNKEGLLFTIKQMLDTAQGELHIVFGVVSDKDLEAILPLLPISAKYYFCAPNITRALNVAALKQKAEDFNLTGLSYKSVKKGVKAALKAAKTDDLIYVGGSTFVVAEVL